MLKCVKNHGMKITSYRFVRALHRPFGCVCMFVANRSEEKKTNRYFVQTKRPCRSLFNFVPHYFQRLFIFSSIQAETTINVCIIAYLSTII